MMLIHRPIHTAPRGVTAHRPHRYLQLPALTGNQLDTEAVHLAIRPRHNHSISEISIIILSIIINTLRAMARLPLRAIMTIRPHRPIHTHNIHMPLLRHPRALLVWASLSPVALLIPTLPQEVRHTTAVPHLSSLPIILRLHQAPFLMGTLLLYHCRRTLVALGP